MSQLTDKTYPGLIFRIAEKSLRAFFAIPFKVTTSLRPQLFTQRQSLEIGAV